MRVVLACFSHCWPSFLVVLGGAGRAVRWRRPSTAKTSRCQRWSSLVWHCTRHGAVTERSTELSRSCARKVQETLGAPLCPCRHYENKELEVLHLKVSWKHWKSFLCWPMQLSVFGLGEEWLLELPMRSALSCGIDVLSPVCNWRFVWGSKIEECFKTHGTPTLGLITKNTWHPDPKALSHVQAFVFLFLHNPTYLPILWHAVATYWVSSRKIER